ncbi:hypothetical protein PHYC_03307 [Phycisphaerales bacterium]|nr:hypothetical protein PHYC_03307 [Phycisphaerales bacterium]
MSHRKPDPADDPAYLYDMLQAARWVAEFVKGRTFDEFVNDVLLRSAVERQIEIVGEAAWRVSEATRAVNPAIPWTKIAGQRHRIIHEYGQLDYAILWRVATDHVPALIRELERIVPAPPTA